MTAFEKVIMQKQFSRGVMCCVIERPEYDPVICILMLCACTHVEDGVTNGFTTLTLYSIQYNPTS